MKKEGKQILRYVLCALLFVLGAVPVEAAEPLFRRPLNTVLAPVYSAHYDNDAGAAAKNYYCTTGTVYNGHQGTDFRAVTGTPVYAAAQGGLYYRYDNCPTTGYTGSTCGGGYGNHGRIDHEGSATDGVGWVTIYAHLKLGTVAWYQSLLCSAKVGESGASGNATGPHLHFEVRKYSYPGNDPFTGSCSHAGSFWVNQNSGVPTTQCQ